MHRHEHAERLDEPAIVTNLPMLVLTTLRQHGRMRPTEIEAATRLRSGHLSALLERLESMGMLTRAQGEVPGDRRAVLVELTPKGRRNAVAIAQSLVDSTQSLLRELDPELERIRSGRSTPGAGTAGR